MRSSNFWQGVVGYWSATAGPSGYRLLDRSGRGNHGTLTNMAASRWAGSVGGWTLDYAAGSANRVEVTTSPLSVATVATQPFTIAAWINVRAYRGDSTYFTAVNIGTANFSCACLILVDRKVQLLASSNGSSWTIGDPPTGTGIGQTSVDLATWTHVAVTRDTSGLYTAYRNGRADGSRTSAANLNITSNLVRIGCHYALNTAFDTDGFIDDCLFAQRAMPEAEIAQLYQIGRGGMLTPRRRRRAYSVATGLRRRLLLTGQV
jgi:hypothetical protein